MEQNNKKMNSVFQRTIAIVVATIIIISCSVSVLASNNNINNFYLMTINDPCRFYASGTIVSSHYDNYCWEVWNITPEVDVYCTWGYNWIGPSGVRKNGWILLSSVNFSARMNTYDDNNNKTTSDWSLTTTQTRTSDNNIFYRCIFNVYQNITLNSTNPSGIPITDFTNCSNEQDCFDYLYELLNTPPTPTPVDGIDFTYSIPAGNVAYFDIENLSNFDGFILTTTMPDQSSLFGPPWWASTQKYGFTNTLPEDGTSVSGLTDINWEKGANGGAFGITQSAKFDPIGPFPSYKYLVIYNPLYYGGTENGPYEWQDNGSITIAVNCNSVTVFSLLSQVGPSGSGTGSATVNTNVDGEPYEGTVDPETGTVSWEQSGETSEGPQTGGSNTVGVAKSIHDWLENIANQISGFFTGAIGAVNTIISAISNFVGTLKSLYMWLPSPVYALLTSAIMVAITIGVIKVFV